LSARIIVCSTNILFIINTAENSLILKKVLIHIVASVIEVLALKIRNGAIVAISERGAPSWLFFFYITFL